jgi:sec-independent protein translocase protein TatC
MRNTEEMSVIQHLEDLRKRLIFTLGFFVLTLIVSLVFISRIYRFLAAPLLGQHLAVLGPSDSIRVYFALSGIVALGVTIPFALYQAWKFVAPGLSEKERRVTLLYIPPIFCMFAAGLVFGYVVVFHMLLRVLLRISAQNFNVFLTATNYFDFLINITLPFGFLFEMPIVAMFLTKLGILNPLRLTKLRKYAYLVLVIIASILSPPELISHLSVAAPMILLYEVSIVLSRVVYRRKVARKQRFEEAHTPG